jgi:protein ImuA
VSALRGAIAKIERKHASLDEAAPQLPFGIAEIDDVLGGGLAPAALHEIAATGEAEIASATGFTLALAARVPASVVLWIAEEMTARESGTPYGPGLDEIGLAPERLVTITTAHARDVLWAMEEALRCRAVGAVIGELRSAGGIGDVAVRRLSLAATERGGLALLLRTTPSAEATPADTRWIVGPAASAPTRHGIGPPAIAVQLIRNRRGVLGSWMLEWNCVDQRFQLASTHPQPLAEAVADRPRRAAGAA